jgi:hypothetical protein
MTASVVDRPSTLSGVAVGGLYGGASIAATRIANAPGAMEPHIGRSSWVGGGGPAGITVSRHSAQDYFFRFFVPRKEHRAAISSSILGVQDWKKQTPIPGDVGFDKVSSWRTQRPDWAMLPSLGCTQATRWQRSDSTASLAHTDNPSPMSGSVALTLLTLSRHLRSYVKQLILVWTGVGSGPSSGAAP